MLRRREVLAQPLRTVVLLFFLLVAGIASVVVEHPPAPLPSSASPALFSAERAMVHVENVARAPHPVGTLEHDRARDYLLEQLTKLGVAPQLQRTTGITPLYQTAGGVENIVVRLGGSGASRDAVLLAAHYDSVPAGPGAGDDASGVAVLLETLRALTQGPPLRNDVIFLWSDGEEEGMLGASAFVAEHPFAEDVRIALNFEARGSGGISQLFETSAGNGRLVRALGQAPPHPRGSSLSYEAYRRMPNDTDLTVLKRTGAAAMNFGFIGHWESYHTPLDNPQRLDRGSLQQHGENALSLARAFGQADLLHLAAPDAVFFTLPGGYFLQYPANAAWPLALLGAAMFLAACFSAARLAQTRMLDVALAALLYLWMIALLALVAFGMAKGIAAIEILLPSEGDVLRDGYYSAGISAIVVAAWTALFRFAERRIDASAQFLGGSAVVLFLTLATARLVPGVSYVWTWPLFCGLVAVSLAAGRTGAASPILSAGLCLLAVPSLAILVPLLRAFPVGLGFIPPVAAAAAILTAVLLITMAPLVHVLLRASGSTLPRAALVAALVLLVAGATSARYGADNPKPSMLAYTLDADRHEAKWAAFADRADAFITQYVGNRPEHGGLTNFYPDWLPGQFLLNNAPVLPLTAPSATLLDESPGPGGSRWLRLLISSPRHGRTLSVRAEDTEVLEAWVNRKKLGDPAEARWNAKKVWSVDYANVPPEGIELRLRVKEGRPARLAVVDRSTGLPEVPGRTFAPRPAESMPVHTGDQTMVLARFDF